jgi:hypothetical protein
MLRAKPGRTLAEEIGTSITNLHPVLTPPAETDDKAVGSLIRQIIAELKPEISSVVSRETSGTREWFLNYGLPKAMRVAQRETYNLLRAYGVIAKKAAHSADGGRNQVTREEAGKGKGSPLHSHKRARISAGSLRPPPGQRTTRYRRPAGRLTGNCAESTTGLFQASD